AAGLVASTGLGAAGLSAARAVVRASRRALVRAGAQRQRSVGRAPWRRRVRPALRAALKVYRKFSQIAGSRPTCVDREGCWLGCGWPADGDDDGVLFGLP